MITIKGSSMQTKTLDNLQEWVDEIALLTKPDKIYWCNGSELESEHINNILIEKKVFTPLKKKPRSFWCTSDPSDVARVEDRTFICSKEESDAGPTNNWMDPDEMKSILEELFDGSMNGRTMYVIPFAMGVVGGRNSKYGVQISDSPYVVASMRIMTRMGEEALKEIRKTHEFVKALHSVGAPLLSGVEDVTWPCNPTKYIVQFPEDKEIWSFGSGYGGNALLGKKCYALRIASYLGWKEGFLAEHMLILKVTSPDKIINYIAAAFPSACGKTNLAMLDPALQGWKVETIGDDIAWLHFGDDGRLYASNPENGFFGVAPGTGWATNPNAMRTIELGNSIFTNVALTDDGDVWWEGMTEEIPTHLTSWKRQSWTSGSSELSSHPNSRFCTPASQCPTIAPEWENPDGVPISAIFFGGRRDSTLPLVFQARNWQHGVFLGATLSSETTAAATGEVGVVRRDPFAMLPFLGYHAGDYFKHWLSLASVTSENNLPKIFYVNWFRKDRNGKFLWPGFSENSRVLKWAIEQVRGETSSRESAIGLIPLPGAIDTENLNISPELMAEVLNVSKSEWENEIPLIHKWFEFIGDKMPLELWDELSFLEENIASM